MSGGPTEALPTDSPLHAADDEQPVSDGRAGMEFRRRSGGDPAVFVACLSKGGGMCRPLNRAAAHRSASQFAIALSTIANVPCDS